MGYDIPGVGSHPDKVVTLTDLVLKGTTDWLGYMKLGGTLLTPTGADINLLAGMAAAGISPVKCLTKTILATTGTAVTTAIGTIPIGSVILDVMTYCTVAFNGATTKTFEVGVAANTDKYIDPSDCGVTLAAVLDIFTGTNQDQKTAEPLTAALDLIATHTNTTHAGAVLGTMVVKVIYV
jgi:hypothetical protein